MTPDMNMNSNNETKEITPPRLMNSLMAGFQSVANHAWVIILPVLVDVFLWFSPRLRVDMMLRPTVESTLERAQQMSAADSETMSLIRDFLTNLLQNFNLAGAVHSIPIGVPSLLSGIEGSISPLGDVAVEQVTSLPTAILLFLGFTLVGFILGGIFFGSVAGISRGNEKTAKNIRWKVGQALLLSMALVILTLAILFPGLMITSLVSIISPAIGQAALLLFTFLLFWFAVPWVYAYHGIFVFSLNAVQSTLTSLRVGRVFLTRTASLVLTVFIISQGLNLLWITPPASSWLLLLGIFGHAIVSAGLLSGSIIYYLQIHGFLQQMAILRQKGMPRA